MWRITITPCHVLSLISKLHKFDFQKLFVMFANGRFSKRREGGGGSCEHTGGRMFLNGTFSNWIGGGAFGQNAARVVTFGPGATLARLRAKRC